jgi:transcriptional regulator with XRE-family HTH domain
MFGRHVRLSTNGVAVSNWFKETPESLAFLAEERLLVAVSELVSDALESQAVSRTEFAKALGVRPSEISQRLSGRRNITIRSLARMLHILGFGLELKLTKEKPVRRGEGGSVLEFRQVRRSVETVSEPSYRASPPIVAAYSNCSPV